MPRKISEAEASLYRFANLALTFFSLLFLFLSKTSDHLLFAMIGFSSMKRNAVVGSVAVYCTSSCAVIKQ